MLYKTAVLFLSALQQVYNFSIQAVTKDTKFHTFNVITEPCTTYSVHTNCTVNWSLYQRTNFIFTQATKNM